MKPDSIPVQPFDSGGSKTTIKQKDKPRFFYQDASGKIAIKARHEEQRAEAKRTDALNRGSLNEMVSYTCDARIAKRKADESLKPPEHLVEAHGEVVDLESAGFVTSYLVDTLENPDMVSVDASEQRMYLAAGGGTLQLCVDAAKSANAKNSLEKMLCHQLAALHRAAMRIIGGVWGEQRPAVDEARLSNAAARLMQVYQEGLLTLQKLRTGGKQMVVVQHVHVTDGGKAVVAGSMSGDVGGVDAKNDGNTP